MQSAVVDGFFYTGVAQIGHPGVHTGKNTVMSFETENPVYQFSLPEQVQNQNFILPGLLDNVQQYLGCFVK